jgi:hypothetical protein
MCGSNCSALQTASSFSIQARHSLQGQAKTSDDIRQSADLGSIKKRFEEGSSAFQVAAEKKGGEQLEMKVAGKAREKFKQIDQEAPKEPVISQSSRQEPSKWAKDVCCFLFSLCILL